MREKLSKQPPPAPTASTVGPCPTIIHIRRTPRHWKFTQNHRTTRPPPMPFQRYGSTILYMLISKLDNCQKCMFEGTKVHGFSHRFVHFPIIPLKTSCPVPNVHIYKYAESENCTFTVVSETELIFSKQTED